MSDTLRRTLTYTVVLAGLIHLAISTGMFFFSGNIDYLNFFNVLSISSVLPWLKTGMIAFLLSSILAVVFVGCMYFLATRHHSNQQGSKE